MSFLITVSPKKCSKDKNLSPKKCNDTDFNLPESVMKVKNYLQKSVAILICISKKVYCCNYVVDS